MPHASATQCHLRCELAEPAGFIPQVEDGLLQAAGEQRHRVPKLLRLDALHPVTTLVPVRGRASGLRHGVIPESQELRIDPSR